MEEVWSDGGRRVEGMKGRRQAAKWQWPGGRHIEGGGCRMGVVLQCGYLYVRA